MKKTVGLVIALGLLTSLSTIAQAKETASYNSNGAVNFIPNTDPTKPVDPTNPDPNNPVNPVDPTDPNGPNPGTDGPLSIDYASSFDFGVNKISNKNETYYARAQKFKNEDGSASDSVRPNYVQVSDNRGNNGGWTLQVKQNGQFTNENTLNKTLTGSKITLVNPVIKSNAKNVDAPEAASNKMDLDPEGSQAVVLSAKKNAGAGTWVHAWGTDTSKVTEKAEDGSDVQADINKEVSLFIPGETPKDAVKYSTTLTWSLTDTPAN